ncbi:helix-turn-helix domain-containing protein [Salinisphaera sp.]|uniref:helix-turn-helix domain-containing protein n=1 Tax=Salinisphaera sp. TaxID=1914330 RepID=UPI000C54F109|nr:helix-turn-helix domain-containing protein [Salinisphaera sp.]MAS11171.1 hypothetical protein [Salinisphaera sp.]|tara:strand:+ start:2484 stop:2792 length:309 start_codon:yes stop_codon:yes gene_type:complete
MQDRIPINRSSVEAVPTQGYPTDCSLLTTAETARITRLKVQTLAQWRCSGAVTLPYVKLGSRVFYRRCDVEGFISDHFATTTSDYELRQAQRGRGLREEDSQ